MMMVRLAVAALVATSLLSPVAAQEVALQRDLDFVRNLASRLGFVSLARSEVDGLRQKYPDGEAFQRVALLGIDVELLGAKRLSDREEQRACFRRAMDESAATVERYADDEEDTANQARSTLSNAALEFGKLLADDIDLARTQTPESVKGLEEEAAEVFRRGEDACEKLMESLEETKGDDSTKQIEYYLTWMRKGVLLREHARAIKRDRSYLAGRAESTLEDLIFDVGEEKALGQRAYFELAQIGEVTGELDRAASDYGDVIDTADQAVTELGDQLPEDLRALMVVTMEEAYDRKTQVEFELGRTDAVIKSTEAYRAQLEKYGVPLLNLDAPETEQGKEDPRFGHSVYLTYARALAERNGQGDAAKGLLLVQTLNQWHPQDFVGLKAKLILKDMIATDTGDVSGNLLLQVAKADYQEKSYDRAVFGFRQAIASMTAEEASEHAMEAYYLLGHSLALQDRVLEATFALKAGLERFGGTTTDSASAEKVAGLVQRTLRQVENFSNNDEFFRPLANEVGDLAARFGPVEDAAKRAWDDSQRLINDERYDDALAALRRIPTDGLHYEWAQARIATALQRKGDFAAAREAIAGYRTFLDTKDARLPDDDAGRKQIRSIAQAEIAFLEGYMLFEEGMGQDDGPKDLPKFPEAVSLLSDFESQHGDAASSLVPTVLYVLGRSYIEMGDLDKAEAKSRQLEQAAPRSSYVAILGSALFGAYHDQVTAKDQEVQAILERGEEAPLEQARQELTALRRKALALGVEYLESSEKPQYANAYTALTVAADLRDWAQVQSLGNAIVSRFENDANSGDKVDRYVRPIIGDAMLRQQKWRQAFDMLAAAEKARPKDYPLKRLMARALGGWQEIDERGAIVAYDGLGRFAEAYEKYWVEYRKYGLNTSRGVEDYSLPWYQFHFEAYHYAVRASKEDDAFKDRAKKIYNIAKSIDDFAALAEFGLEGKQLQDLFLDPRNQPPQ
ncbi:MAG: hypothetical protein AAF628_28625 [Planctomycetota bacterium]